MKSERLLSLDILRGITIVGMILVNNPGTWESIYAPLRHAEWNGLTPTDLVFPFFMFIMGVSMSFALSRFDHHFSRGFIIKLVRRTVILFLLGLFLSWFSLVCTGVEQPFSHIRILGVLQLFSYGCPLNKKVWSPTFVLVTCGFASLLLVFLTWLIDIRKKQKWGYPFHVFGTNPLFIYIVAGVLATLLEVITVGESSLQEKIYTSIWSVLPDAHLASLIYGLLFIGFNYLIVWGLYKKQLFIKI